MARADWLERTWYGNARWPVLLWPLAAVFGVAVRARRWLYRRGWLSSDRLPVPVIVVGNITVGGTGKTPLVLWLIGELRRRGWRPGVVSRGYRGKADSWPRRVHPDSDPRQVGDEPVLLARRLDVPVAVAPRRAAAARLLLEEASVDAIVADDGLQHHRLARDVEIAVVDGGRRLGNGRLLPAGPLREPVSRLREVDLCLVHAEGADMWLRLDTACSLVSAETRPLRYFGKTPVHAVVGIGHPARFFEALRRSGLRLLEHVFPDHYDFRPQDIDFEDDMPVLMTEKDAVKCRAFAGPRHWYVPAETVLAADAIQRLGRLLDKLPGKGS